MLLVGAAAASAGAQPCPDRAPLPAYAHNDYDNRAPLADALRLGYAGAEADVLLADGVVAVAHGRRHANPSRSLEALYLQPLRSLVRQCGRVLASDRPFLLNIELKERSPEAYDSLAALLDRYGDLLTERSPGGTVATAPVEVVFVGWHPPLAEFSRPAAAYVRVQDKITSVDRHVADDSTGRVRLVSLDYGKTIGREPRKRALWLAELRRAKSAGPGRIARVYNAPVRRDLYATLLAAGVDLIGTENLERTRRELEATLP
jgi:hypothetical protein